MAQPKKGMNRKPVDWLASFLFGKSAIGKAADALKINRNANDDAAADANGDSSNDGDGNDDNSLKIKKKKKQGM